MSDFFMGDDVKVKAVELAAGIIDSLKGRAKEFYESRYDVRDMVVRVTRAASELALELAATDDPYRRDSIKESLLGAEDAVENEVAAVAQDAATESVDALKDALQMAFAVAREVAPLVADWIRRKDE